MTDNQELRKRLIERAKSGIAEAYSNEEHALMQAINAWLELNKSYNLACERLGEWFGIYAPELRLGSPTAVARLAIAMAEDKVDAERVREAVGTEKADETIERLGRGMGRKMNGDEAKAVKGFADYALKAGAAMEVLEAYLKESSNRIMPNLTFLTDEKIAAEMLSKAGSLEKLATMPASTVQLLGAEKALFKHIKYGSAPPKYGILFKLPDVTAAPREIKGRIARIYATKLTIALKADYFSKRFIAEQLRKDLDAAIKRIRETPHEAKPERPDRRQGGFRGGPRGRFGGGGQRQGRGRPGPRHSFPPRKGHKS